MPDDLPEYKHGEYIMVHLPSGRRVLKHRLVYELFHGKTIKRGMVVHHKDEDTTNNVIENLELMTNAEHAAIHSIKRLSLVDCICETCGDHYQIRGAAYRRKIREKQHFFCSRQCIGGYTKRCLDHGAFVEYAYKHGRDATCEKYKIAKETYYWRLRRYTAV